MSPINEWQRVSPTRRCPICDHPDWCLISADGNTAICPRTESAKRCGEAGWLHRLDDSLPRSVRVRKVRVVHVTAQSLDFARMAKAFRMAVDPARLYALAERLGLSVAALHRFRVGWSALHNAWTFPMIDPSGNVLGIRLRSPFGSKYAIQGSKQGLFIPDDSSADRLLITKGPTDAAALLDMGFPFVVGRPNCTGGIKLLVDLLRRHPVETVIVSDADDAGRNTSWRPSVVGS